MGLQVSKLLAAAQQEWKAKLDAGRVYTVFKVGDQVLLLTKELLLSRHSSLQAAAAVGGTLHRHCLP